MLFFRHSPKKVENKQTQFKKSDDPVRVKQFVMSSLWKEKYVILIKRICLPDKNESALNMSYECNAICLFEI
jgi:hypothetical protein